MCVWPPAAHWLREILLTVLQFLSAVGSDRESGKRGKWEQGQLQGEVVEVVEEVVIEREKWRRGEEENWAQKKSI